MAADQQDFGGAALEADETGLHSAFGRQESSQSCMLHVEQGKILCELAVQEAGGVFALHADHAKVGNGGYAMERLGHG
ncbi:hypothetical protein D3C80_1871310 [compost metagenome]